MVDPVYFALIFGGIMIGIQGERWRVAWARSEWRARQRGQSGKPRFWPSAVPPAKPPIPDMTDAAEQLKVVMAAPFEKRPLLSRGETNVFYWLENAVKRSNHGWRVMAQVNLGEILGTTDRNAFRAINSKRVDLLLICNRGLPIAAFEYQGEGHYQGSAPARDAVKKEALRKAGVRYVEVTPEHSREDIAREVSRIASVEGLKKTGS